MRDKWRKVSAIAAIGLMVATVVIFFVWANYGEKKLIYTTVIEASREIPKGTPIDGSMLKTAQVDRTNVVTGAFRSLEDILGKDGKNKVAVKYTIPKNSQLAEDILDQPEFVLKDNQRIFRVPSDWIMAVPSSLRRKDHVFFYAVDSAVEKALNIDLTGKVLGASTETAPGTAITPSPSPGIPTMNIQAQASVSQPVTQFTNPILDTYVAYVKDSANREVVNTGEGERLDGSSQVASVEIIVQVDKEVDQIKQLQDVVEKGGKFLILYN